MSGGVKRLATRDAISAGNLEGIHWKSCDVGLPERGCAAERIRKRDQAAVTSSCGSS